MRHRCFLVFVSLVLGLSTIGATRPDAADNRNVRSVETTTENSAEFSSQESDDSGYRKRNTTVDLEAKLSSLIDSVLGKMSEKQATSGAFESLDEGCSQALLRWVVGLKKMRPWALKLLDAMGRPPSGLASGTISDLGQYDQCLKTVARDRSGDEVFRGQYCSLFLKPSSVDSIKSLAGKMTPEDENEASLDLQVFLEANQDVSHGLRIGVCVPSTCSGSDLTRLVNSVTSDFALSASFRGCAVKQKTRLKAYEKVLMCVVSLLISFVIVATALDVFMRSRSGKSSLVKSLSAGAAGFYIDSFSAVTNTQKLLHVPLKRDMPETQRKLSFFHGVRFFSSCWIILGHGYLTIEPSATGELGRAMQFGRSWLWCLVGNAYPAVQTFLYMSGFLLAYNYLEFEKKGGAKMSTSLKVTTLLLRRYIRVTAPLMFVVACWLLVPLMFDGPLQVEHYGAFFESCQRNWWKVLLHINNLSDFFDMCLQHTWYVGVDWQIYMFIWVIPILMTKRPRLALMISFALILVTSTIVFAQAYAYSYQPVSLYTQPQLSATMEMMKAIYYRPHAHLASYVIGVVMGYIMVNWSELKLGQYLRYSGWTVSTAVALAVIFIPYKWFSGAPWDGLDSAIYAGYAKTAWALTLCWLTVVCVRGYGGPVNSLLSWRALVPLSRLTYGAYLIHSPLYLVRAGILRERFSIQHYHLVMEFFGCLTMAYLLSYLMYLVCEAPVARLEKLAFEGSKKKKSVDESTTRVVAVRL